LMFGWRVLQVLKIYTWAVEIRVIFEPQDV
jgi:hypothetical protein